MPIVIVQKWEEKERGWGSRPDGFSLHMSENNCKEYIKAYWAKMPDYVPDTYSAPYGDPYVANVSDELFAEVENVIGARKSGRAPEKYTGN